MVSISAPSFRNTFAVLRRFMECLLREFTAMNARPPAIRPAALLLIYASVFFDMVISSFLKVCFVFFCNFRKRVSKKCLMIHTDRNEHCKNCISDDVCCVQISSHSTFQNYQITFFFGKK